MTIEAIDLSKINPQSLYPIKIAATLIGYTPQTLIKYIRAGEVKAKKQGRRYFISGKDLLHWWESDK